MVKLYTLVKVETFLNECYEKAKRKPQIWISFAIFLFAVILLLRLLLWFPHWQVSQFGINNATENATLENQYRTTIAQILGGVAIGISLYYTWQRNNIAQEGQITERFTRAIDQFGNRKMEIRLGGIYTLERIANESEKDYWSIMEILTAYVRNNSGIDSYSKDISLKNVPISIDIQANESTKNKVPKIRTISDIQAILTVIARRKYSYGHGETKELNFQETNLQQTNLLMANLSGADLRGADLSRADLSEDDLSKADLSEADLSGVNRLTIDQLSKVKTLYNAKLDDELLIPLKEKYPALFENPF